MEVKTKKYLLEITNLSKAAFAVGFGLTVGKHVGEYVMAISDGVLLGLIKRPVEKLEELTKDS